MRGKQAPKRKRKPDPKHGKDDLAIFINLVMQRGKKSIAQDIVYSAFDIIAEKNKTETD